jgi:hypothetical protein
MKAILRWFELISGLKVNFSKSCLVGINVGRNFLDEAANFLHCKIGKIPFIYLSLPVGANPRIAATWRPVVNAIEDRLSSWRNRYVSLGGRVILINSVLYAIPIFYLSFFKLPSCVRLEIIQIQRNFLWGGTSGDGSKIPWVKWLDVCRPKKEGGLGIKDLKVFNFSLIAKWRWRLLVEGGSQWKKVMSAKYGEVGGLDLGLGVRSRASLWWKDLVSMGVVRGVPGDWLHEVFVKKLDNGSNTKFWHDICCVY